MSADREVTVEVGLDGNTATAIVRETREISELFNDDGEASPHAELHKPDHAELREAFEGLLDTSDHPHGPRPITVEEAEAKLCGSECKKPVGQASLPGAARHRGFHHRNQREDRRASALGRRRREGRDRGGCRA